jgi:GT2 family glycosyltransferase
VKPLAIIPTFVRAPLDVELVSATLRTLHETAGHEVDTLVVDDGSPAQDLVDCVADLNGRWPFELVRRPENEGFARTVNVGLRRALEEGRDAILVNADIEFIDRGWAGVLRRQHCLYRDGLASVVGARLLYPNGLLQHAGIYFSLLTRDFNHLYKYGPHDLPEAMVPAVRPVTGALQLIRHECLTDVGLYDEEFQMAYEDVDYCLRVMLSGRECVYQPGVRAVHHESLIRGRDPSEQVVKWTQEGFMRLMHKYARQSFAGLVPTL